MHLGWDRPLHRGAYSYMTKFGINVREREYGDREFGDTPDIGNDN
jgi:hypothetical protein